jgi:hypothetical protein
MKIVRAIKTGLLFSLIPVAFSCCSKTNTTISDYKVEISSINPGSGGNNTSVTIKGKGFSLILPEDSVKFNGKIAQVTQSTDTSITAYAPSGGSTGPVSVTVNGNTASGPVFTYDAPAPVITNVVYNGLFAITGEHFDPQASVVKIGGQTVTGFGFTDLGNGQAQLVHQNFSPASNLNNPAPVAVVVNNVSSNIYSFLFSPVIHAVIPDTVYDNESVTLQGILFGDRTLTSNVRAYYFDQGQNKTYMSPDPAVVSWNTNSIQVTMPDYGGYPIGAGSSPFYLEVNVGAKSGRAPVYFHIL